MRFDASLDRTTKIATFAVTALFLGVIIFVFVVAIQDGGPYGPLVVPVMLTIVMAIVVEYRITGYDVTANGITIRRPAEKVFIKRSEILKVEVLPREKLKWSIRTFGVGGFFGYFGSFYNKQLGAMTWYLTRRDKLVLVKTTSGKRIILSPDDPEKFVAAVELT